MLHSNRCPPQPICGSAQARTDSIQSCLDFRQARPATSSIDSDHGGSNPCRNSSTLAIHDGCPEARSVPCCAHNTTIAQLFTHLLFFFILRCLSSPAEMLRGSSNRWLVSTPLTAKCRAWAIALAKDNVVTTSTPATRTWNRSRPRSLQRLFDLIPQANQGRSAGRGYCYSDRPTGSERWRAHSSRLRRTAPPR